MFAIAVSNVLEQGRPESPEREAVKKCSEWLPTGEEPLAYVAQGHLSQLPLTNMA
jgi:hypothetical protein